MSSAREIDVLIISNKFDYSTDYICLNLEKENISYLRINRDNFHKYQVFFDLTKDTLEINLNKKKYLINRNLRSVYYRAPTYLRETYLKEYSTEKQLYNSQWMAFIRNLTFFEQAKWVNNPNYIFKAENKILQLKYAREVGFLIPKTMITNSERYYNKIEDNVFVVKGLDTVLFKVRNKESFFYTQVLTKKELENYDISLCPVVFQNYLYPKIDIRVTVIEDKVYSVRILSNGKGIDGDWRKKKDLVEFIPFNLPESIKLKCIDITKKFNLKFAGIDLVFAKDKFYFLELNPTGEWGWLVKTAKLPIDKEICKCLTR